MYVYVETCEAAVDANLTNSRLNLHVCVCVCVCVNTVLYSNHWRASVTI